MNRLYIDTRKNEEIVVRLETGTGIYQEISKASRDKAQAALPMIEKALEEAKIIPTQLDAVNVETGPGSFTGLRVGVAIANSLAFGALIKINGEKLGDLTLPEY
jgi:tRNA threonylcarbamoyladenosine biosynthesis protein TsaB